MIDSGKSCVSPSFCPILTEYMNVTPSLPQRGRQSKGSIPLTPVNTSVVSYACFDSKTKIDNENLVFQSPIFL